MASQRMGAIGWSRKGWRGTGHRHRWDSQERLGTVWSGIARTGPAGL